MKGMTPEKILKKKFTYPNLQDIKISNPEKYKEITQKIILDKLSETLPYFNKWQKRNNDYPVYEASLSNLKDIITNLDYSIYDMGLEGKRELTEYFYQTCSPYKFQDIVDIADSYDIDTSLKIKNLVNRSFRKFYSNRQRVISHIKKYVPHLLDGRNYSILNYVPFQNPRIGIEWLSKCKFLTLKEICEGWVLLLCIDLELFSPETFYYDIIDYIGKEKADLLIERLAIFLAGCPYKKHPFVSIERQLLKRVAKYRKLLNTSRIITIPMKELRVKTNKLQYEGFDYKFPYRLTKAQRILLKTKLYSLEETSIVIPKETNSSDSTLNFLFKEEEDMILSSLNSLHTLNASSKDLNISTINKIDQNEEPKIKEKKSRKKIDYTTNVIANDRTIEIGVKASDLIIKKNVITFTATDGQIYSLRSVRIGNNVNTEILEKINHRFTLVKDRSGKSGGITSEHRFLFEPANDFSFLLAEIDRLSTNPKHVADESFPLTGEFDVPWRYVLFYEGVLVIIHPNPSKRGTFNPFHFRNSDILKTFEDIRFYIENKSPKLRVQAADGVIISLLNFKEFMSVVSQYKDYENEEDIGFGKPLGPRNLFGFTKEVFQKNSFIRKSPYLSYLATLHNPSYNILYLLERIIHESGQVDYDEYGYLFVIKKTFTQMVLLYENISDSSRSSILFYINPEEYTKAVEIVRKFLASEIKNKRQKLSFGLIRFNTPCIRQVQRIKHTDLIDWKYNLQFYL